MKSGDKLTTERVPARPQVRGRSRDQLPALTRQLLGVLQIRTPTRAPPEVPKPQGPVSRTAARAAVDAFERKHKPQDIGDEERQDMVRDGDRSEASKKRSKGSNAAEQRQQFAKDQWCAGN